jgi:hypothetical protein
MRRSLLFCILLALLLPAAGAASFQPFSFHGTVIAAPLKGSRYVAGSDGQIYSVFVPRAFSIGTNVVIRGSRADADPYTVWATPPDGSIRATGRTSKTTVRAELVWVDASLNRFQLASHGQIVGWVHYPQQLEPQLLLARQEHGPVTLHFRLGLSHGRLTLLALLP